MEVLKQKNGSPVEVAHQVCILYAVINGYLADIAVEQVSRYEAELFEALDNSHREILDAIAAAKVLSPETEEALKAVLAQVAASLPHEN